MQGVHRGEGFGERSGRAEADGGRHDGEGYRTAIGRQRRRYREQGDEDRSEPGEREEAAGNFRTEEMITGVEDEGEIRTEERKEICSVSKLMATHAYTRIPENLIGNEIDLQRWDTLVFK